MGNEGAELQWGRDLTVADSPVAATVPRLVLVSLQWGRDLTVADSEAPPCPSLALMGFNGAAT